MADEKNVRHRFTVPSADNVVNEWIENQSNLGFSLRVLIRAFVRQYGNKDATCVEFGEVVAKRGRPRMQDNIRLGQMMSSGSDSDDYDASTEDVDENVGQANVHTEVPTYEEKPIKPIVENVVETVVERVAPVATVNSNRGPSIDPMEMLNAPSTKRVVKTEEPVVPQSVNQSVIDAADADEDGFIDPDDL